MAAPSNQRFEHESAPQSHPDPGATTECQGRSQSCRSATATDDVPATLPARAMRTERAHTREQCVPSVWPGASLHPCRCRRGTWHAVDTRMRCPGFDEFADSPAWSHQTRNSLRRWRNAKGCRAGGGGSSAPENWRVFSGSGWSGTAFAPGDEGPAELSQAGCVSERYDDAPAGRGVPDTREEPGASVVPGRPACWRRLPCRYPTWVRNSASVRSRAMARLSG